MIKSMTGYGSAKAVVDGLSVSVELKSVNNRFLDCSVRMPKSFLFAEDAGRARVQTHVSRGEVGVRLTVASPESDCLVARGNEKLLEG